MSLAHDRAIAYLERFCDAMELLPGRVGTAEPLPEVREITVEAGRIADQSLRDARIRERFGVTVTAVSRATGEMLLHPSADTVVRAGDRVRLFGLLAQITTLVREMAPEPEM